MNPLEQDKYRLLVEAVTDYAIHMLDAEGRVASWNAGAERIKGYPEREILGQHFSRFHTDADRAAGVPERALRTAREAGRFESESWRVRKDGTRFWAHVVVDPVYDDGSLIGYAMITRDLTEQMQARERLRRSEEQFRLLVQGVGDYAIYMLDADGRVVSWNAGAERIKGYGEREILGRHFSTFYTGEDIGRGQPARNLELARRNGMFESEGWRVRKDGTRFWAHVVIDRLDDAQGNLAGFAKITRDITEKKKAEEALAVAREALFQAQKTESIGQLTGGVAHDFNNLLMAVLSNLELLEKWLPEDPRPRRLLTNARAGAERGVSLTQRMLAFARRQELHPRPTDVPALVSGMADLLQRTLGPNVSVHTRFGLKLPPVLIDGNQLELALLNLAVNGRDAMPEGGVLEIGARRQRLDADDPGGPPPGDYLCLWVSDEGIGMDAATLERATEPFFTTKGIGKGTGLGLSMAHGLAEQSGGRLRIESTPGTGTTVQLWLPVARDARQATPAPAPVEAAHEPAPAAARKILLVDDDDLVLTITAALLEDMGHEVVSSESGEQALDLLRGDPEIGFLLTDHAMPGMTGARLVELALQERPGLPAVIASGYAELPEEGALPAARLAKPFTKRDLARAIGEAMRRAHCADGRARAG